MDNRSTVIKAFAFILFTLGSSLTSWAAHRVESHTPVNEITVDGDIGDWATVPTFYLDESLRVVALSHDDTSLYIMFRFGDSRLAESLIRRGVVLWVNGDGKKEKPEGRLRRPLCRITADRGRAPESGVGIRSRSPGGSIE